MNKHLTGTGVAIVTPFKNGQVDYHGLTSVIKHVIKGGVDYIVSLGSTGEAITCSSDECRMILDHTINIIAGKVALVAGPFGYNDTKTLVKKVKSYDFSGIDAILSSSPSYIKPTQDGIYRHFMKTAEASPVPVILYNVPGRTSSNMNAETTLRLAEQSTAFVGVKEASGDLSQCMQIAKHKPENFLLISGDDELTLPMISCGAEGVISVIANAYPKIFSDMVSAALSGDFERARIEHYKLLDIHPHLYIEGNPTGIKGLLELMNICSRDVRLPLTELSKPVQQKLRQCMTTIPKNLANPV